MPAVEVEEYITLRHFLQEDQGAGPLVAGITRVRPLPQALLIEAVEVEVTQEPPAAPVAETPGAQAAQV
jgi:hypothetical protein